jgi:hypothetical protein
MRKKKKISLIHVSTGLLLVLLAITAFQSWQIYSLESKVATAAGKDVVTGKDVVKQIAAEIIPAEGTETDYGIPISTNSMAELISYRDLELTADQLAVYDSIAGSIPCVSCCRAAAFGQCGCGHAQAYQGLTKYLLREGYSEDYIRNEITKKWQPYFFPEYFVQLELPAQRGGC